MAHFLVVTGYSNYVCSYIIFFSQIIDCEILKNVIALLLFLMSLWSLKIWSQKKYDLHSVYPSALRNVKLINSFLCLAFLSSIDIWTVTDSFSHINKVNASNIKPSFLSFPLSWLTHWLCLFLSGKEIHPSLLHCTTWTRTRWMPMPWPSRLLGRLSRTTTVTRCSPPWDLEPNCPQTEESPTNSPWWVNFGVHLR